MPRNGRLEAICFKGEKGLQERIFEKKKARIAVALALILIYDQLPESRLHEFQDGKTMSS